MDSRFVSKLAFGRQANNIFPSEDIFQSLMKSFYFRLRTVSSNYCLTQLCVCMLQDFPALGFIHFALLRKIKMNVSPHKKGARSHFVCLLSFFLLPSKSHVADVTSLVFIFSAKLIFCSHNFVMYLRRCVQ